MKWILEELLTLAMAEELAKIIATIVVIFFVIKKLGNRGVAIIVIVMIVGKPLGYYVRKNKNLELIGWAIETTSSRLLKSTMGILIKTSQFGEEGEEERKKEEENLPQKKRRKKKNQ